MKKILLLTALLSVGTVNAQIMKAEPATPVKILTLQDVEVQKIKNEIIITIFFFILLLLSF